MFTLLAPQVLVLTKINLGAVHHRTTCFVRKKKLATSLNLHLKKTLVFVLCCVLLVFTLSDAVSFGGEMVLHYQSANISDRLTFELTTLTGTDSLSSGFPPLIKYCHLSFLIIILSVPYFFFLNLFLVRPQELQSA